MRSSRLVALAAALSLTALAGPPAQAAPERMRHVARISYSNGSDLEFITRTISTANGPETHDYAIAGRVGQYVQVIDITDPEHPVRVSQVACRLNQNDIQIFGTTLVMAADVDSYCVKDGVSFGVKGFATADISDPRYPVILGRAQIARGAHNTTVHPTEPLVYVSNSDGSGGPIVHIWDISSPAMPTIVRNFTYAAPTDDNPHDITFNASGTRAYAAALGHTAILDTTDPRNPSLITAFGHREIYISHQADPSPDGHYLYVSDELGGGLSPVCPGGGVHIYDISDEQNPVKVGAFWADEVGPALFSCTSHVFRINPGGTTMSIAWYNSGVYVFDISDPGYAIAGSGELTGMGARTLGIGKEQGSDAWAAKMWQERHPGYVFVNDLGRGFDVFYSTALGTP